MGNSGLYPKHRYFDIYLELPEMHKILRTIWSEAQEGKKHSDQELCKRITLALHPDLVEYPQRWNSLEPEHLSVIGSFVSIIENRLQLHILDSSFIEFRKDCIRVFKEWPEPADLAAAEEKKTASPKGLRGLKKKDDHSEFTDRARLTPTQEEAYSAIFEYGLSKTEAAKRLGITRQAVQSRVNKAKTRIDHQSGFETRRRRRTIKPGYLDGVED